MGAAMAAGSQKWNGTSALFEIAPTSTSAIAHSPAAPVTGCATSSDERARAAGDDEHDEADEHREPAERRDGERLQRGTAALLPARVVADEEVREHARRLPEHEQEEHVVGGDEAEHDARRRRAAAPANRPRAGSSSAK